MKFRRGGNRMTDTLRPEYTAEQVEAAVARLTQYIRDRSDPYPAIVRSVEGQVGLFDADVMLVLSALSTAESKIAELREPNPRELSQFRNLLEKNADLRSRLERAERDTERLDFIDAIDALRVAHAGCHRYIEDRETGAHWHCGDEVGQARLYLCADCEAKRDAAIAALVGGGGT